MSDFFEDLEQRATALCDSAIGTDYVVAVVIATPTGVGALSSSVKDRVRLVGAMEVAKNGFIGEFDVKDVELIAASPVGAADE